MPNKARLMQDGRERFVSIDALQPGAVFRVKSGERIPADGIVVAGRSHADEIGAHRRIRAASRRAAGDGVVCGSINTGGVLEIRATRVGAESTLARIVRTVEQAAASRTRMERAVDRAARLFIPAVLALAVLTFAGWQWHTGKPGTALMHAIAVLVIACPCALGIATPLALTAAVAAASRRGILVSDTRVLETIRGVDSVVLDKTGTATSASSPCWTRPAIPTAWRNSPPSKPGANTPSGRRSRDTPPVCARKMSPSSQAGDHRTVNGTPYFLGNRALADHLSVTPAELPNLEGSVVYFGWDGEVRGALSFGDRVRPEAAALCADLRRRGIRTMLLSGDARAATAAIAGQIGADEWIAEALPERKVAVIRELQQQGTVVAMIGDGVNDAPSLAQADLGIALGSGTDIAMQAAPLVLMGRSLAAVSETLDLARRTFTVVRQNLFWAFAYNLVGITLAMAGVLNPIMAAAAMVLSSLSVIGNSRRLKSAADLRQPAPAPASPLSLPSTTATAPTSLPSSR